MTQFKFTDEQIPTDAIRIIVNRTTFKKLPTIIGVQGESQSGKSTAVNYIINRTEQIFKYGSKWQKHKNEWDLWDYKKFCTKTPLRFAQLYKEYDNISIALEEAKTQGLSVQDFFKDFTDAFSDIADTQGMKLNRLYLITPFLNDLLKMHKRKINLIFWVAGKNLLKKSTLVIPRKVKPDMLSLKDDNIRMRYVKNCTLQYDDKFLTRSYEYINWLKVFKADILKNTILKIRQKKYFIDQKTGEITIH